jgi:thymidylate synthase (FAD)
MILVKPSFEVMEIMGLSGLDTLFLIEKAGRTCYKSEDKITPESTKTFVKTILSSGHESVIEHSAMTIKFICDRGVSHELVRHRLCAFSQESTRYVNYKGGCTFIIPPWCRINSGNYEPTFAISMPKADAIWYRSMLGAEVFYKELLDQGWSPQQARSILPNSTKTEIVVTANFREWRHILKLRCGKAAHPQMRELMLPLLDRVKEIIPIIFDDINY